MKKIIKGVSWIQIDDDRINVRAITRYRVVGNELKIYLLAGELLKITLDSQETQNHTLQMLDEICQLA